MKHHMIIKLKNTDNIEEYAEDIRNIFSDNLPEGIKRVDVFSTNSKLRNRFDLMIKVDINKKALETFEESKAYKQFIDKYNDNIKKITVFDCN